MSGSFSKQKSNQSSTQDSSQQGFNVSSSFGTTGSGSSSTSSGQSTSSQDVFLGDLFKQIYGGAVDAAAGVDTGNVATAASKLFSGGLDFLGQLGGGAGADALKARIGDTSARDAQLDTLKTQLGDFFNTQLVPGITSRGVSTGTLGGARDAVELGQASKQVAGQFATGASSIIASDQAGRDSAAAKLGDLTNAGAGTGLSALSSLLGLAQGGETAGLLPYQLLSSIIGGPTVLGQSQSSQLAEALSSSFGEQGSSSYGFDTATSHGVSTGTSSGFGISGGIGFAPSSTPRP
jgi:hypothetical protein